MLLLRKLPHGIVDGVHSILEPEASHATRQFKPWHDRMPFFRRGPGSPHKCSSWQAILSLDRGIGRISMFPLHYTIKLPRCLKPPLAERTKRRGNAACFRHRCSRGAPWATALPVGESGPSAAGCSLRLPGSPAPNGFRRKSGQHPRLVTSGWFGLLALVPR